ncbi:MAG TPA: endonuclease/exonuclease/phosphatase family protein [Pyrinomonadaceae bacterium]|nr:endonuclease/exonuclease/phosphatase family protein [Pyrinomonadaceae bacterium]
MPATTAFLFVTAALLVIPTVSGVAHQPRAAAQSRLLEVGRAGKLSAPSPAPNLIKIISYNIRWRSGDDLKKLIELFKSDPKLGGPAVLGLQEVDRNKMRSGNTNTAKQLADELGMHYAWAAPPPPSKQRPVEEETGVAILSAYPMSDVRRFVLPHAGPGGRRRAAIGATIQIGNARVRFYSIHSETRVSIEKKLDQMAAALADVKNYSSTMPIVIVGDFNTWELQIGQKVVKLFTAHRFYTPFDNDETFSRRVLFIPLQLKLDWIWLRNLDASGFGIERSVTISDHWPLWINLRLSQTAAN